LNTKQTAFLVQLKTIIPAENWPWILVGLHQDPRIWLDLNRTDLGQHALETFKDSVDLWNPAALALLALGKPAAQIVEILGALKTGSVRLEDQDLSRQAAQTVQEWLDGQPSVPTLAECGLVALSWRENIEQPDSWRKKLDQLQSVPPSGRLDGAATALACLFAILPDPQVLLGALLQPIHDQSSVHLALHALLSNPQPEERQEACLQPLLVKLDLGQQMALLKKLALHRPQMAARLAQAALATAGKQADQQAAAGSGENETDFHPEEYFASQDATLASIEKIAAHYQAQIQGLAQLSEIEALASHPVQSVHWLAQAIRKVRRLQGHLSAQLARAVEQAQNSDAGEKHIQVQEASLDAWREAVQLVPEEALYSVALGAALLQAGKTAEAQPYLQGLIKPSKPSPTAPLHSAPALDLGRAQVARSLGDQIASLQYALRALQAVENNYPDGISAPLDQEQFINLCQVFAAAGKTEPAIRTAELALQAYPASYRLHTLLAHLRSKAGQFQAALEHTTLALALASGKNSPSTAEEKALIEGLQRLLGQTLEAVGAWESALEERTALLQANASPDLTDLLALANCALKAGKPSQALQICQRVLQSNPEDHRGLSLSAQVSLALGDPVAAVEQLQRAIRLSPHNADLWLELAQAHQANEQPTRALEILQTASQALPHAAEVHLALGEAYLAKNLLTQALNSLRRAEKLEPSLRSTLRLGQTLIRLGHYEEARQYLKRMWSSYPETDLPEGQALELWAELAHAYAQALQAQGEIPAAIQTYIEAVRLRPDDPWIRLELVQAQLQAAEVSASQQAVASLEQILEGQANPQTGGDHPDRPGTGGGDQDWSITPGAGGEAASRGSLFNIKARALLAEAYRQSGDLPKALESYRRVYERPGADRLAEFFSVEERSRLADGFGRVALELAQPQTAVTVLKDALADDPGNLTLQQSLSEAYLACGLPQEAFETARKALERSPASLEILTWFIEQATRIEESPGGTQLPVRPQVIRALDLACRLVPSRVDLLARLGRMLVEIGDQAMALETFHRLASTDGDLSGLAAQDLFFAGKSLRQLGDPQMAIVLLNSAVKQVTSVKPDSKNANVGGILESPAELYAELAQAYHQLDGCEDALQALEQAIILDGQRVDFYLLQSDLHEKLGHPEKVLESLNSALCLEPNRVDIQLRAAELLRQSGDLPGALLHAEQAVLHGVAKKGPGDHSETALLHSARLMAAELGNLLLRPQQAWVWVHDDLAGSEPSCEHFEHVCLRAEMALDAGDIALAGENLAVLHRLAPQHTRTLANQARLFNLCGDGPQAESLFENASRDFVPGIEPAETEPQMGVERLASLRAVCTAALELHHWEQALALSQRWVQSSISEPLGYLRLAQVLVVRAEDAQLSQDLWMIKHAPGEQALSEQAHRDFENAMQRIQNLLLTGGMPKDTPLPTAIEGASENAPRRLSPAFTTLTLWQARGQSVFAPDRRAINDLGQTLKMLPMEPGSLAAVVMALRRIGETSSALKAAKLHSSVHFNGSDPAEHVQVLLQKALSLVDSSPEQALEILRSALEKPALVGVWPGVPALLQLQARLYYQTQDTPAALQSIQQALEVWPDEPRWHALAADIVRSQIQPDLEQALEHLEQAACLQPDCSAHYLALGKLLMQAGEDLNAVRALQQAVQIEPKQYETWLALAQVWFRLGDLEQAASSAERAIETASDANDVLVLRGEIALQSNNPRGALSRAQAVLRQQPEHGGALYLVARSLAALDRPDEALVALDKVLSLHPALSLESGAGGLSDNGMKLYQERIEWVRRAKGEQAALSALQELVERQPERLEFQALLAEKLLDANQVDTGLQVAQAVVRAAVNVLPATQLADLHYRIAQHMRRSGQLDQAIAHLSEAVKLKSDFLDGWLELGRIYQEQRAHNQALKTYLKAVELAPNDYRPYYLAGVALKEAKDYLQSEEMLRQAARLAPDEVSIHRLLGAVVALNLVHNRRSPV
jgi:tetratricopeptide (TPR) repeat protein